MSRKDHIKAIEELSASERVFTAAQAQRLGIPRGALSKACESGRLVRILHGAYKMAGVPSAETDELEALWKLTKPAAFTHERAQAATWDGITIGGTTAAAMRNIGDFYLSPYILIAPKRIRTRLENAMFVKKEIARDDVTFENGLPVTRLEQTILDLALLGEDPSLVRNALDDARTVGLDDERLARIIERYDSAQSRAKVRNILFDERMSK